MRLYLILVVFIIIFLSGCKTYHIMYNHHPEELMELKIDSEVPTNNFIGKKFILTIISDLSTSPTGALVDECNYIIYPFELSYNISKPGYVLFERIAEELQNQNSIVHRNYLPGTCDLSNYSDYYQIYITFEDFQIFLHRRDEKNIYLLASSDISLSMKSNLGNITNKRIHIDSKVEKNNDILKVLAQKFINQIYQNI